MFGKTISKHYNFNDSLALVHILNGNWEIPWNVTMEVNYINRLRNSMSVRIKHSLREGDTLANVFSNLVFLFGGTYEFRCIQEVPYTAKRITILDKQSTLQLRIRQSNTTRS